MTLSIDEQELHTRIDLNYDRLANGDYYRIDQIFSPSDYDCTVTKRGARFYMPSCKELSENAGTYTPTATFCTPSFRKTRCLLPKKRKSQPLTGIPSIRF